MLLLSFFPIVLSSASFLVLSLSVLHTKHTFSFQTQLFNIYTKEKSCFWDNRNYLEIMATITLKEITADISGWSFEGRTLHSLPGERQLKKVRDLGAPDDWSHLSIRNLPLGIQWIFTEYLWVGLKSSKQCSNKDIIKFYLNFAAWELNFTWVLYFS